MRTALQVAGKHPGDVRLVSLHGTGTPLGDPIEVGALGPALAGNDRLAGHRMTLGEGTAIDMNMLSHAGEICQKKEYVGIANLSWTMFHALKCCCTRSFVPSIKLHLVANNVKEVFECCFACSQSIVMSKHTQHPNPLTDGRDIVGSVKACYGHTEGTAGLQGALCSILSLQMNVTPAIMHLRNMNPYVSAAITDWRKIYSLQAAIPRVSVPRATLSASMLQEAVKFLPLVMATICRAANMKACIRKHNKIQALCKPYAAFLVNFLCGHEEHLGKALIHWGQALIFMKRRCRLYIAGQHS